MTKKKPRPAGQEGQMAPAKRPPGRPRKSAADKLAQFSIRLSPKLKLGLELLARHRGVSLSDAVAMVVTQAMRSTEAGPGMSIEDVAGLVVDLNGSAQSAHLATLVPELATPMQRFYKSALDALYSRGCPTVPVPDSDFYKAAIDAFRSGDSPGQLADRWEKPLGIRPWNTLSDAELMRLEESTNLEFGATLFDAIAIHAEIQRRRSESKRKTRSKIQRVQ